MLSESPGDTSNAGLKFVLLQEAEFCVVHVEFIPLPSARVRRVWAALESVRDA